MKKITRLLLASIFLFSACTTKGGIEIRDAWMRPTAQGENGAVYFILHNYSSSADELVFASSDRAEAVELHESMIMDGDIMAMEMNSSLLIDGQSEVTFEPGGYHIMLVALKEEAKLGDSIEVVLHFKNNEDVLVQIAVQESDE